MRLFEILENFCSLGRSAPFVLYQQSAPSRPVSCLTYEGAYQASKLHKKKFQRTIMDRLGNQEVVMAFLAQNSADLLLATIACTEVDNALPVLLNTRWTPSEMAQALKSQNLNDATILVHDEAHAHRIAQVAALLKQNHPRVTTLRLSSIATSLLQPIHKLTENASTRHRKREAISVSAQAKEYDTNAAHVQEYDTKTALVLFTGGTTGGAKGVLLSHQALSIQAQAKLRAPCGYDANTKILATTVPMFHVGGLSSALAVWMAKGVLVFPSTETQTSGFQPQIFLQSLQQGLHLSPNTIVVVPAMLSSLMNDEAAKRDAHETHPNVRLVLIGGQSASFSLLQLVIRRFPNARIVQTYACTEAASSLTFLERRPSHEEPSDSAPETGSGDCIGRPPAHIELCLFHNDTATGPMGEILQPCAVGVIATRGPHVSTGYWQRGGATTASMHSIYACKSPLTLQGWFVSNDLGYQDIQGRFYFSGRVADVIRTGGETVLATEVERTLLQLDPIAECAVFALPDDKFGETVCVAVVLKEDSQSINLTNLRNCCAEKGLAGYKRPRQLFNVKALPRNSSGKLLKRVLVKQLGTRVNLRSKL